MRSRLRQNRDNEAIIRRQELNRAPSVTKTAWAWAKIATDDDDDDGDGHGNGDEHGNN